MLSLISALFIITGSRENFSHAMIFTVGTWLSKVKKNKGPPELRLADDCRLWNDPLFLPITAGLPLLTTCSFKYLPCLHTTYHTSCLSEMIYFLETPCGLVFQANKGKISMAIFKILVLFSLESNYCHIVCVRIR